MNPWICPRCDTVNGPCALVCMNPHCGDRALRTTTIQPLQPLFIPPMMCPYCRVPQPCGQTHVTCRAA